MVEIICKYCKKPLQLNNRGRRLCCKDNNQIKYNKDYRYDDEYFENRDKLTWIYEGKCSKCNNKINTSHHIIPIEVGGTNYLLNLIPLCYKCHIKVTKLIKKYCRNGETYEQYDGIINYNCFYKCLEMI